MDNSGNPTQPVNGQIKKPFQWPHDQKPPDETDGTKKDSLADSEGTDKKDESATSGDLPDEEKEETKPEEKHDPAPAPDTVIHYPYGANAKKSETPPLPSTHESSSKTGNSSSFQLLKDDDRKTIDELKEHALKMVAEERAEIERQAEERKKQLSAVEESLSDPRITEAFYYLTKAKEKVSGS